MILCWVSTGGYPSEEFGKKGQTERGKRPWSFKLEGGGLYLVGFWMACFQEDGCLCLPRFRP